MHVTYFEGMVTMQIRGVSEETSRILKARAAAEDRSLSDYLLRELNRLAERPTREDLLRRIEARGRVDLHAPIVAPGLAVQHPNIGCIRPLLDRSVGCTS